MRGFEIADGYKNTEVKLPARSTTSSAGYDFSLCRSLSVPPGEIRLAETGIKAYMKQDEVLKIYPRSSLPKAFTLTIPNGVGIIDADYYENPDNDGAIFIQLYNFGTETVTLEAGTRIAQGIFERYLTIDADVAQGRRNGGFGSTGMR